MVWDWSTYLADYGQPASKYLRVNPNTALTLLEKWVYSADVFAYHFSILWFSDNWRTRNFYQKRNVYMELKSSVHFNDPNISLFLSRLQCCVLLYEICLCWYRQNVFPIVSSISDLIGFRNMFTADKWELELFFFNTVTQERKYFVKRS